MPLHFFVLLHNSTTAMYFSALNRSFTAPLNSERFSTTTYHLITIPLQHVSQPDLTTTQLYLDLLISSIPSQLVTSLFNSFAIPLPLISSHLTTRPYPTVPLPFLYYTTPYATNLFHSSAFPNVSVRNLSTQLHYSEYKKRSIT